MTDINVDTVKMRDCGNDIKDLAKDLEDTIEAMFNRISNMPERSEWVGDSASRFVSLADSDKMQYIALKESLNEYGNYLVDSAEEFEKTIRELKVD